MNHTDNTEIVAGVQPDDRVREVRFADSDTVTGHEKTDSIQPLLKCWDCGKVFPVLGRLDADTYYVCPECKTLNLPDPETLNSPADSEVPPPPGDWAFKAPVVLDSVFLRGPDGSLFELPLEDAERYMVTDERAAELGHPPYEGPKAQVAGHHLVAGGAAGNPSNWSYHKSWEFGCYFDEVQGGFCTGMHRHPYGDERAIPASPSDFA